MQISPSSAMQMFNGSLNLQRSFPKYKMKNPLSEAIVKINDRLKATHIVDKSNKPSKLLLLRDESAIS